MTGYKNDDLYYMSSTLQIVAEQRVEGHAVLVLAKRLLIFGVILRTVVSRVQQGCYQISRSNQS